MDGCGKLKVYATLWGSEAWKLMQGWMDGYLQYITYCNMILFPFSLPLAVLCPLPVRPVNGRVSYSSTLYGSVATYSCNIGYTKNGTDTRTCDHSGVWSPPAPVCEGNDVNVLVS